jgi:hypothetical protein
VVFVNIDLERRPSYGVEEQRSGERIGKSGELDTGAATGVAALLDPAVEDL